MFHVKQHLELQWYPVNTVTNGPKRFGQINGVAVLSGQVQIS